MPFPIPFVKVGGRSIPFLEVHIHVCMYECVWQSMYVCKYVYMCNTVYISVHIINNILVHISGIKFSLFDYNNVAWTSLISIL